MYYKSENLHNVPIASAAWLRDSIKEGTHSRSQTRSNFIVADLKAIKKKLDYGFSKTYFYQHILIY